MSHSGQIFYNKIRHTFQAEYVTFIIHNQNIPQSASLDPKAYDRTQKVPVGKGIGKFGRQRPYHDTGNGKPLLKPQFFLISKTYHHTFTHFTSAPHLIRRKGQLPLQLIKTCHVSHTQKSCKGIVIILVTLPGKFPESLL